MDRQKFTLYECLHHIVRILHFIFSMGSQESLCPLFWMKQRQSTRSLYKQEGRTVGAVNGILSLKGHSVWDFVGRQPHAVQHCTA
jgi:hypothetical protein